MAERGLRAEIVAIVRELYEARLVTPTGGNVSARLAGEPDRFLITPTGLHKGDLRPEDVVCVDSAGRPIGRDRRPSVETPMHLAIYDAYPGVGAVVHSHAPLATALGLVGGRIPPITVDAVPFVETETVPYGPPGDPALIERVVEALARSPAVLLQNHGLLTVGQTLRHAANRTLALEEVVRVLLACRLLGREPTVLPEETIARLREMGMV